MEFVIRRRTKELEHRFLRNLEWEHLIELAVQHEHGCGRHGHSLYEALSICRKNSRIGRQRYK